MVDCLPHCLRRRGAASKSLLAEQIGVTDDLGAFRHFYVLDHPEGQNSLRKHLRPTFPVDLILEASDNTVHKHPASFNVDIRTDTLTITLNKHRIPYLTFSMSHGNRPTTVSKDSYMEGDNKIIKLHGSGSKTSGCGPCMGTHEEEFDVELFFVTPMLRDYVASVLSGLGHQDSSAVVASKVASPYQSLKIFVGSWNFGNNPPPTNLEPWIPVGRFDLYAIGMQESPGENIKLVKEYFGDEYVPIKDEVMGVIRLIVLVRKTMVQYVRHESVESFQVASGILGGMGINKGGVGVALRYRNTPIAFIASHLAARATAKRCRRRNKDVRTIVGKMSFGLNNVDVLHQYNVFWLGDLNYRITLPWEETVSLIQQKQWGKLRKHDQLLVEQSAGRVFHGYKEMKLNFPPSYKYLDFKNTAVWDPVRKNGRLVGHVCKSEKPTPSSRALAAAAHVEEGDTGFFLPSDTSGLRREYTRHKMQTPSWTDRILNKPLPGVVVNQETCGCADEIQTSDHTPVFATYNMRIPLPPPASVNFLKCTIHVSNVKLINPRVQGEGFGGIGDDELEEDDDELEEDEVDDDEVDVEGSRRNLKTSRSTSSNGNSNGNSKGNSKTNGKTNGKANKGGKPNRNSGAPKPKDNVSRKRRSFLSSYKPAVLAPVLAIHVPFLKGITKRTAYKTSNNTATESVSDRPSQWCSSKNTATSNEGKESGDGRSFTWHQTDLPIMGPFFTKMEYMEHRHIIFRVQGNAGHGAAGNTVGYCTLSLSEMVEKRIPVRFQCTLLREGQPAGELEGEVLIKWLDSANMVIGGGGRAGAGRGSRSRGETKSHEGGEAPSEMLQSNPLVKNNMRRPKQGKNRRGTKSVQLSDAEKEVALKGGL